MKSHFSKGFKTSLSDYKGEMKLKFVLLSPWGAFRCKTLL